MSLQTCPEVQSGAPLGEEFASSLFVGDAPDIRSFLAKATPLDREEQLYGASLPVGSTVSSIIDHYSLPKVKGAIMKPDALTQDLHRHFAVSSNLSFIPQDDRNGFLPDDADRATRLINRAVDRLRISDGKYDELMRRDMQKCLTRFRAFARRTEERPDGRGGLDGLAFGFCLYVASSLQKGFSYTHTHENTRVVFCKTYRGAETYVDVDEKGFAEELGTRLVGSGRREIVFRGSEIYFKGGQGWSPDAMLHHKQPGQRDGARDRGPRINFRLYAQLLSSVEDSADWVHGDLDKNKNRMGK